MHIPEWSLLALFLLVLIGYPAVAWWLRWKRLSQSPDTAPPERALALPNGSVRGLLALLAVGTFVLVLADAAHEHFEHVATAFGTLTGAMIGFYFGTRTAQKKGDLPGDKP